MPFYDLLEWTPDCVQTAANKDRPARLSSDLSHVDRSSAEHRCGLQHASDLAVATDTATFKGLPSLVVQTRGAPERPRLLWAGYCSRL